MAITAKLIISFPVTANDLRLCFRIGINPIFSRCGSFDNVITFQTEIKEENVKKENVHTSSPPIKIEKKEIYHLDSDVIMNSPKPLQAKLNVENDLNMHTDEHDSEHIEMNISMDEVESHKSVTHTPKKTPQKKSHTPKTPVRNNNGIIDEQLLISPDSSRPLIMTEPKSRAYNADEPNRVKLNGHGSKLNATILSNLADTPNVLETSAKSSVSSTGSASPSRLVHKTFIEDSPAVLGNQSSKSRRLVITDSPENSGSDEDSKNMNHSIKMDASILADSVLEESMVDENDVHSDVHNVVHSATKSFNRSGREEKRLEKSMHDLELDDDGLPKPDTNPGAKSFLHDNDDMLPDLDVPVKEQGPVIGDNHLPDLDSPVVARSANKSKSFKKYVIESSDENSDTENVDDRNVHDDNFGNGRVENVGSNSDDNDTDDVNQVDLNDDNDNDKQNIDSDEEMDHSGNDADSTGNRANDNEEDAGEEVEEGEEDYEEEESEEEDDGLPGKCDCSIYDSIKVFDTCIQLNSEIQNRVFQKLGDPSEKRRYHVYKSFHRTRIYFINKCIINSYNK